MNRPGPRLRPNLADDIATELREQIVGGSLRPGTRLLELRLAERFGTSQGPVREALRLLERDGLVTHVRRRGVYVRELSVRDLDEIYSLRAALEGFAARRAALRIAPAGVRALKRLLERMAARAEAGEWERGVRIAIEFHEEIAVIAGHDRLLQTWRSIMAQTSQYAQLASSQAPDVAPDVEAHKRLLDAVTSGDPDRAEAEGKRHAVKARNDFLRDAAEAGLIDLAELDGQLGTHDPDEWTALVPLRIDLIIDNT
jgi:DNA-binding GntR family transcriptional regulator